MEIRISSEYLFHSKPFKLRPLAGWYYYSGFPGHLDSRTLCTVWELKISHSYVWTATHIISNQKIKWYKCWIRNLHECWYSQFKDAWEWTKLIFLISIFNCICEINVPERWCSTSEYFWGKRDDSSRIPRTQDKKEINEI